MVFHCRSDCTTEHTPSHWLSSAPSLSMNITCRLHTNDKLPILLSFMHLNQQCCRAVVSQTPGHMKWESKRYLIQYHLFRARWLRAASQENGHKNKGQRVAAVTRAVTAVTILLQLLLSQDVTERSLYLGYVKKMLQLGKALPLAPLKDQLSTSTRGHLLDTEKHNEWPCTQRQTYRQSLTSALLPSHLTNKLQTTSSLLLHSGHCVFSSQDKTWAASRHF